MQLQHNLEKVFQTRQMPWAASGQCNLDVDRGKDASGLHAKPRRAVIVASDTGCPAGMQASHAYNIILCKHIATKNSRHAISTQLNTNS